MPNLIERAESAIKAARTAWSFGSKGNGNPSVTLVNDGNPTFLANGTVNTGFPGAMGAMGGLAVIDYAAKVGDIWRDPTVFIALGWIMRNGPDARIGVEDMRTEEIDLAHPMAMLLARPNPYYSYSTLMSALYFSYALGDAYALPRYSASGDMELYWQPSWKIRPIRDGGGNFIDAYLFKQDNKSKPIRLEPSEVIHLRNGIDPDNEMCGFSPIKNLLLSVYSSQQVNRLIAALATNSGMTGAVFTHKPPTVEPGMAMAEGAHSGLTQENAAAVKQRYRESFTGDRAGDAMVLDGDWEVEFPKISVDATFLEKAKAISQAEVAGAFGIPAVVLQYIVGLASATAKASHKDSREQAYTECLMPMQRSIAEDLTTQLLPHFTADPRYRVVFDYRKVGALADDANETAKRWLDLFTGNVAMLSEARRGNGLKTDSTHDYFARELPGSPVSTADPAQTGTVPALTAPDPNDNEKTL